MKPSKDLYGHVREKSNKIIPPCEPPLIVVATEDAIGCLLAIPMGLLKIFSALLCVIIGHSYKYERGPSGMGDDGHKVHFICKRCDGGTWLYSSEVKFEKEKNNV